MANEIDESAKNTRRQRERKSVPPAAGKGADAAAGEPENSIRPSRRKARAASAKPAVQEQTTSASAPAAESAARAAKPDPRVVPEHIHRRFVAVGHRYYFADGAHAFTDRGSRLTTQSENTEVIKSLVAIAESRGWTEITVSGTARFKKEAWAAASVAGLNVRGFRPTELERAQLARTIARELGRGKGAEAVSAGPRSPDRAPTTPGAAPSRDRFITGRLVEHGPAPYRHDPHERMSYVVKLETPTGVREIWGVDLQRALKESLTNPKTGDEVGLRAVRRDAVKVPVAERDEYGTVVRETPLETHRNHWILEKQEFFAKRAAAARTVRDVSMDPKEAARRHPELVGTYLQMRAAELAAKQFRDPQDRATFVARIRAALADAIARGEPLNPVRLRERPPPARAAPSPSELAR